MASDDFFGGLSGAFKDIGAADPFTLLLQKAQSTADAALKAQQDANLIAAAANVPTIDSESARAAGDTQRRKLLSGSSFGIGLPAQLGAPPVGFRLLSGE